MPSAVSWLDVMATLRESTSISPDCRAEKRSLFEHRAELDRILVAEDGRRQGTAEVDADAAPGAVGADRGVALGSVADAADQMLPGAHRLQHAGQDDRGGRELAAASCERRDQAQRPTQEAPHAVHRVSILSWMMGTFLWPQGPRCCSRPRSRRLGLYAVALGMVKS